MAPEKKTWSSAEIFELIAMYQNHTMFWDPGDKDFFNRNLRAEQMEVIAEHFQTTSDQVLKKIHNLRSQLAQELKKQATKKRKDGSGQPFVSRWPYLKVLSFLTTTTSNHNSAGVIDVAHVFQDVDSDLVEVDVHPPGHSVDYTYEHSLEAMSGAGGSTSVCDDPLMTSSTEVRSRKRPADQANSEEVLLKAIKVLTDHEDEHQVFGRYIATELRSLFSDESRRQLKRSIQRAVVQVADMDDMLRMNALHPTTGGS